MEDAKQLFPETNMLLWKKTRYASAQYFPPRIFIIPAAFYEGIQLYLDLSDSNLSDHNRFLSFLGIDLNRLSDMFCKNTGLYIHQMSDDLSFLVKNIWETKETEAENIITSDLSKKYTVPCLTALYNLL